MRSALAFAWRFAAAYAVFVTLWLGVLEHHYNDGLAWASRRVLAVVEMPRLTTDVRRRDDGLVVTHVPRFAELAPQEITTRRVHSNTALFVALTLATPAVSWRVRAAWLVAGGVLLAASHLLHVLAYVHHHYALHNVGPYFTLVDLDQLRALGLAGLWDRPAALRRGLVLAIADVCNIVLQRAIPIALWLPLALSALAPRRARVLQQPAPPASPSRWARPRDGAGRMTRWGLIATVSLIVLVGALVVGRNGRTVAPETIEGVRPGMGAVAAAQELDLRGYDWTPTAGGLRGAGQLVIDSVDVWPRRGPLDERRYGGRYNWIGIELAAPAKEDGRLSAVCVTAIRTVPSDARPERIRLDTTGAGASCTEYWQKTGLAP